MQLHHAIWSWVICPEQYGIRFIVFPLGHSYTSSLLGLQEEMF